MVKTFSIKTLGCKLNQYESSLIAGRFIERGWEPIPFGQSADIVIINTCTVTDRSDKKCRNYIRQGARLSGSGKAVVTGCLAESCGDELSSMPDVLASFGVSSAEKIIDLADGSSPEQVPRVEDMKSEYPAPFQHTRGFLKIQDGCDGACSYCIVPSVRGKAWSRPFDEVIGHAQRLIGTGCPEIVLTGITTGNYSFGGRRLSDLVRAIIGIEGDFRLRITSIEPEHATEDLIEAMTDKKVCRHIHLPLQSGSDRILSQMNRPYTRKAYVSIIDKLRRTIPGLAVGTDIIIGFPGESEDDFNESVRAVSECGFSYVHQFSFSPRKGTPASIISNRAGRDALSRRSALMRETSLKKGLEYREAFKGLDLVSVIEKNRGVGGYSAVSGNYIKILLDDSPLNIEYSGKLAPVRLETAGLKSNTGYIIK
jgi:threonylcarbamoyladenosine tRNA methylthiotransferase MtaB